MIKYAILRYKCLFIHEGVLALTDNINFVGYMFIDGFGGLVVSMLASGTQGCGFKPGRSRWIFRA